MGWQQWMRTEGRQQGLSDPVIYNGPPLAHLIDEEMDKRTDPEAFAKKLPSMEEIDKAKMGTNWVPEEMKDGQWNDDREDASNIFNLWRRPLHTPPTTSTSAARRTRSSAGSC